MALQIRASYEGRLVIGEDFRMAITVVNDSGKPLPEDARVALKESPYWFASSVAVAAGPHGRYSCYINFDVKGGADVEKLPNSFHLSVVSGGRSLVEQSYSLEMHIFRHGLSHYAAPRIAEKYNILCFGPLGSGKSAFIQTVLTLASNGLDKDTQRVRQGDLLVGGTAQHATTEVAKYDSILPANFYDVWGVSTDNYKSLELEFLLDGFLPAGYKMKYSLAQYEEKIKANAGRREQRMIHAVVFFLPWSSLEDDDFLGQLQSLFQRIKGKGFNPLIMLARVDELEPSIRTAAMKPGLELQKRRREAATKFGVPLSTILYTVNYTEEQTRDFDIDRLCYKNVDCIMKSAIEMDRRQQSPAKKTVDEDGFDWS